MNPLQRHARHARHATSFVLLALAAGALAYAYIDRGSVTETEKRMREGALFPAWRREDLGRISLTQGAETVVLERQHVDGADGGDTSWFLRSPRNEPADEAAVQKLLSVLEFATVLRTVDADAAAEVGGLAAPRLRGSITMGAVTYNFALGGDAPSPKGATYMRLDGTGILAVTRELATELLKPGDAYRTRTVVPYFSIQLAKLEVKNARGGFVIARADDVSFRLPDGTRVSRDAVDRVWSALGETRAEAFVSDADADRAIENAPYTILMTPKDASQPAGTLVVGGECPGHPEDVVVVRKAPTRLSACAPKGITRGLDVVPEELADAHLFVAHDDEVEELKLESVPSGLSIDLGRKTSGWHQRSPADRDLAPDEVEAAGALMRALAHGVGSDPTRDAASFEVRGRASILRVDSAAPEVVEIGGALANGDVLVRRVFDGVVLRVDASLARKLTPRATSLRGRTVWEPPLEGKSVESIATACDDVTQAIARGASGGAGDAWRMTAPQDARADDALRVNLVDAVTRIKADAWIADADDGSFGFGAPCAITLRVVMDGGRLEKTTEKTLLFGAESRGEDAGGIYARVAGDAPVFLAAKELRDLARTWLVARPSIDKAAFLEPAIHLGPARQDEGFAHPTFASPASAASAAKDASPSPFARFRIGAATTRAGVPGYFVRADGTDATFFLRRDVAEPLLAPPTKPHEPPAPHED